MICPAVFVHTNGVHRPFRAVDVGRDGVLELGHTAERASSDGLAGDDPEEDLPLC